MKLKKKLLVVALASAFAQSAHPVERIWNTSHAFGFLCDGSFTNVDCWGAGGNPAPGLNDIATWNFNHANPFTVTFSGNITNQQARIRQDNIAWALNGHTYSLTADNSVTNPGLAVGINNGETGRLTIRNGTVNAARTVLAINGSSNGYLTLDNNATLNAGTGLTVGYWEFTSAALSVLGGSRLNSSGTAEIGFNATANGSVLVTGTGSRWDTTGRINVGSSTGGTGSLVAGPGGKVAAGSLTASNKGSVSTGTTISTAGGIVDVSGALALNGGGKVTSYFGFIGSPEADFSNSLFARGGASITGAGSEWITHDMRVAQTGTSTLTVSDGGKVSSTANLEVGTFVGSTGTMNVTNGGIAGTDGNAYLAVFAGSKGTAVVGGTGNSIWNVTGGLYVGGKDSGNGGTGTLTVNSGGKVTAGSLKVWNGSSSVKTGTIASATGGIVDIAGAMALQGGGKVTSYFGFVGDPDGGFANGLYARGGATITGSGSEWITHDVRVAHIGVGNLTVSNGGKVSSAANLEVGTYSGSNGTMAVSNGGVVSTDGDAYLAVFAGSTGTVSVGGTNSVWNVADGLYVGGKDTFGGGTGKLTVNTGGTVSANTLKIWNGGTLELYGGTLTAAHVDSSLGQLKMTDGTLNVTGTFNPGANLYLDSAASHGLGYTPTINLNGATATVTSVTVGGANFVNFGSGGNGRGALNIINGATLTSTTGSIATNNTEFNFDNGHITVGGSGSLWTNTGSIYVGGTSTASGGTGTLTVKDGGKLSTGSLTVWNGASSIDTGNTAANSGVIAITGALTLSGGGRATSFEGFIDSAHAGSSGGIHAATAEVGGSGALWAVTGGLHVGGNANGSGGTGTLTVDSGGKVTAGKLTAWNQGSIGTGTTMSTTGGIIDVSGAVALNGGGKVTGYFGFVGSPEADFANSLFARGGATITGSGSEWTTHDVRVAQTGVSTLTVSDGGKVSSIANLEVGTFPGSNGTMAVSNGGIVGTDGNAYLAVFTSSTGAVTVGGTNSIWSVANGLYVGGKDTSGGGSGKLTVNTGGTVSANTLKIWHGDTLELYGGTLTAAHVDSSLGQLKMTDGTLSVTGTFNPGANLYLDSAAGNDLAYTPTINLNGATSTVTSVTVGGANLGNFGGGNGRGVLNVINGATLTSTTGSIATSNTAFDLDNGHITVGGGGALWANTGSINVGGTGTTSGGTGTLTVDVGGKVTAGSLTVWNGSSAIKTGATANTAGGGIIDIAGALTLQGGGSATSYQGFVDSTYVGSATGIYAHSATIGGTGSRWDTTGFYTGLSGVGTTTVASGGEVSSAFETIVGQNGGSNGTLNVTDGGRVFTNSSGAFLGYFSGATGSATVGGSAARWDVVSGMFVGGNIGGSGGTGTLTIKTGGTVAVGGVFKLWDNGTLNMNGGTLDAGSLENHGVFNFNAGTVNVTTNLSLNGSGAPGSMTLGKFDTLSVGAVTTLNDFSTLDINGGRFSTGSLVDNGGFAFNSGTFNLTGSNLVIGAGGQFGGNVEFDASRTMNVTNTVTINSGAILGLNNAAFSAGTYDNSGTVDLAGSVTVVRGASFNNSGILTGNGTLGATLANGAAGQVRAVTGDTLTFTGTGNTNAGLVNLLGGTAAFDNGLTNAAGGLISGHGALIATGGLNNNGTLATTAVTDIQGNVTNGTNGHIVIAGTTTTFYHDILHNGAEFKVNNGAQAVFFGSYSGAGSFTGTGELVFAGDLMPGNSPALIGVEGDLTLLSSSVTTMELGGLARGSQYDAFDVGASLSLAGTLDVVLVDLGGGVFAPQAGDSFDLFAATTIQGSFGTRNFAALGPNLSWNIAYLTDAVGTTDVVRLSVTAVPEPQTWMMLLAGLGLMGGVAMRRRP